MRHRAVFGRGKKRGKTVLIRVCVWGPTSRASYITAFGGCTGDNWSGGEVKERTREREIEEEEPHILYGRFIRVYMGTAITQPSVGHNSKLGKTALHNAVKHEDWKRNAKLFSVISRGWGGFKIKSRLHTIEVQSKDGSTDRIRH